MASSSRQGGGGAEKHARLRFSLYGEAKTAPCKKNKNGGDLSKSIKKKKENFGSACISWWNGGSSS